MNYIPIYKPFLPSDAFNYAIKAMESTWISSQGYFHDLAQQNLASYMNMKYCLLLTNGTAGVHLMAKAIQFKYPTIKKIIVPDGVFISALTGFLYDNYFKLIVCPIDINTWNYDLKNLDIILNDNPDAACLIVHNIGNVINVPDLKRKYTNTVFVEDNCEGFTGKYEQKLTGSESLCSVVSFYGNKSVSSGEGGAFFTNDKDIYEYLYQVHNCGQGKTRFVHDELGYNYRMTNVQAAILCKQLEYLPQIKDKKNAIFQKYHQGVSRITGCFAQEVGNISDSANWMFGLRLDSKLSKGFDHANKWFRERNIEIRPFFYPLSCHRFLTNNPIIKLCDETVVKELNHCCIILPSFPELSNEQQQYIIYTLQEYILELS